MVIEAHTIGASARPAARWPYPTQLGALGRIEQIIYSSAFPPMYIVRFGEYCYACMADEIESLDPEPARSAEAEDRYMRGGW